jgi:hypothetical protein
MVSLGIDSDVFQWPHPYLLGFDGHASAVGGCCRRSFRPCAPWKCLGIDGVSAVPRAEYRRWGHWDGRWGRPGWHCDLRPQGLRACLRGRCISGEAKYRAKLRASRPGRRLLARRKLPLRSAALSTLDVLRRGEASRARRCCCCCCGANHQVQHSIFWNLSTLRCSMDVSSTSIQSDHRHLDEHSKFRVEVPVAAP